MENLYKKLSDYAKSDFYPFHMPGHKRNQNVTGANLPYHLDITEIDGFDDLHHAEGILADAQKRAAQLYCAEETHFLVNGSTSGLLSAILGTVHRRGKILIARNCHKSVYNAVFMGELYPIYLYPQFDKENELNGEILAEDVERMLEENRDVQAVVITSPTYDGVVSDVRGIAEIVHQKGIPLIVDEAHGAHFGLHPYFPQNSNIKGADVVIHSLHKTMPSLTQTALIHINGRIADRRGIRRYLHMIQTSSPSYILMASMDECIRTAAEEGERLFHSYTEMLKKTRQRLAELKDLALLETACYDRSKIVVSTKRILGEQEKRKDLSERMPEFGGIDLYRILLDEYHIQPEMAAGSYIIAMTGPGDTEEGMERLVTALEEIDSRLERGTDSGERQKETGCGRRNGTDLALQKPEQIYTSWETELERQKGRKTENLIWEDTEGKIAAEPAYLYPPGIPLVVPGERISREIIQQITLYEKMGFTIEGTVVHGKMEVMADG